jgi:hypothetical protein
MCTLFSFSTGRKQNYTDVKEVNWIEESFMTVECKWKTKMKKRGREYKMAEIDLKKETTGEK